MFQFITNWNLFNPEREFKQNLAKVESRGYNSNTHLTGQFTRQIRDKEIKSLTVSDIAYKYCPTRRDLYFRKLRGAEKNKTDYNWTRLAGMLVEDALLEFEPKSGTLPYGYKSLIERADNGHNSYKKKRKTEIEKLESKENAANGESTEWLLALLKSSFKNERAMQYLHHKLRASSFVEQSDIAFQQITGENKIGISADAKPDFVISKLKLIGDMKTSTEMPNLMEYQLLCAGYALGYESAGKDKRDMDFGSIYFLKTKNPISEAKTVYTPQVFIFPIDEPLRNQFIHERDNAYGIISKAKKPDFPENKEKCKGCYFLEKCKKDGLKL